MTPELFMEIGISSALGLLPPLMDTPDARAMLVAIALQETKLLARRQFGGGPARSYLQFELAGIEGVFTHGMSGRQARGLCLMLDVGPTIPAVYEAIEFNDVLACGFGRLLLWTLPLRLPKRTEPDMAWLQYLEAWRPKGWLEQREKPRPEKWSEYFARAWALVGSA